MYHDYLQRIILFRLLFTFFVGMTCIPLLPLSFYYLAKLHYPSELHNRVLHTISPVLTYTPKGSEASSAVDCKAIQNYEAPFGLRSSEG